MLTSPWGCGTLLGACVWNYAGSWIVRNACVILPPVFLFGTSYTNPCFLSKSMLIAQRLVIILQIGTETPIKIILPLLAFTCQFENLGSNLRDGVPAGQEIIDLLVKALFFEPLQFFGIARIQVLLDVM